MAKWSNKWYMVNDKIVNDLVMEKKLYIIPLVEVELWNMRDVMKTSQESETPVDPGPTPAPERNKVF